jgi:hypothetical protein
MLYAIVNNNVEKRKRNNKQTRSLLSKLQINEFPYRFVEEETTGISNCSKSSATYSRINIEIKTPPI